MTTTTKRTIKELDGIPYSEMTAEEVEMVVAEKIRERNTPRKLGDLLNAETYQDMTDEEIEKVISFREEQAAARAKAEAEGEQMQAQVMRAARDTQQVSEQARALIDWMNRTEVKFRQITGTEGASDGKK